jgi:mRNA-degrading endonuclease RelE of RelBE toxin-antitoxin system
MFRIELTPEAVADLTVERRFDQVRIIAAIEEQLPYEPDRESRNRKRLRPNRLAEWALRVDNFRIFYDVLSNDQIAKVVAVGRKDGNTLLVHGEEFEL